METSLETSRTDGSRRRRRPDRAAGSADWFSTWWVLPARADALAIGCRAVGAPGAELTDQGRLGPACHRRGGLAGSGLAAALLVCAVGVGAVGALFAASLFAALGAGVCAKLAAPHTNAPVITVVVNSRRKNMMRSGSLIIVTGRWLGASRRVSRRAAAAIAGKRRLGKAVGSRSRLSPSRAPPFAVPTARRSIAANLRPQTNADARRHPGLPSHR